MLFFILFVTHTNTLVLLAGAGFSAHMIPCHIGVFAVALLHAVFQHGADGIADIFTNHLPLDDRLYIFHYIAVGVQYLLYYMGLQQLAAVHNGACCCDKRDGSHRSGLPKALDESSTTPIRSRCETETGERFVIHINAGALQKAERLQIVAEYILAHFPRHLNEIRVARVIQPAVKIKRTVAVQLCTVHCDAFDYFQRAAAAECLRSIDQAGIQRGGAAIILNTEPGKYVSDTAFVAPHALPQRICLCLCARLLCL